jgi:hypothetical protein
MRKNRIIFLVVLIAFINIVNISFALNAEGKKMVKKYGPIPKEITNPSFEKEPEVSPLRKVVNRFLRIFGSFPRSGRNDCLRACFARQRVLLGAAEMYNMDNKIKLKKITDREACDKLSELVVGKYLKGPISKIDGKCEYQTYGDLTESGVIYCKHHGAVGAAYELGVKVKYKESDKPSRLYALVILILGPFLTIILVVFIIKGLKSPAK